MRPPHPELNFRRGKALNRFDPKGFIAACRLVGMKDSDIKAKLEQMLKDRGSQKEAR